VRTDPLCRCRIEQVSPRTESHGVPVRLR
jgi:hypothetical protein